MSNFSVKPDSLKNQVVDGLKWSILAKLFTQVFSWISTFMVIRMLTPDDYGIIAIAMVFITFISMFSTSGLISALVRTQERNRTSGDQIFTLSIFLNILMSAGLVLVAPLIADAYDNPALKEVLWVLAAINPISSLSVVPVAHLQMEMRFKDKAVADGIAGLIGAVTAFTCAFMGMAYWALIFANIALNITRTIGLMWFAKSKFGFTSNMSGARDTFAFAINVQLGTFVWFLYNKFDTIIIARLLGVDKVGVYNVGSEVASIPMSKVGGIVNDVGFAAFSKVKGDRKASEGYLKKANRMIGMLSFPVFFGLSVVSNELVLALLGEKWSEAGVVIMALALIFPLRMSNMISTNYANAMGEARFTFVNGLITSIILISCIALGAMQGLLETALGWVMGFMASYLIIMFRFHSRFDIKYSSYVSYLPALLISVIMWIVVHLVGVYVITPDLNVWLVLGVKILVGVLVVAPFHMLVYWKELKNLLKR